MTVVIITHNSILTAMADRVIKVKSGAIASFYKNEVPTLWRNLNGKKKLVRMDKNNLREIKYTWERYIAILAIITLGVAFFAGLVITKDTMVATLDNYLQIIRCMIIACSLQSDSTKMMLLISLH